MYLVRYSIATPYVLKEYEYIDYTLLNEYIESTHTHHTFLINIIVIIWCFFINNFMQ